MNVHKCKYLIAALLLSACQKSDPVGKCNTYQSLSLVERMVVSNGEKALLKTGKSYDFSMKCVLVGKGNGGRFVVFDAPDGKSSADVPTTAYAARTTMDGKTVEYINLSYPFGEWEKIDTDNVE